MRFPAAFAITTSLLLVATAFRAAPPRSAFASDAREPLVLIMLTPDLAAGPEGAVQGPETTSRMVQVLRQRAAGFGFSQVTVAEGENNQIVLTLPASLARGPSLRQLTRMGRLEFRWLKNIKSPEHPTARYQIRNQPSASNPSRDVYTFHDARTARPVETRKVLAESALVLTGADLRPNARSDFDPNRHEIVLAFELNPHGAAALADFTRDHVGEFLAVVFDGEILVAPQIRDPILNGKGIIQASFKTVSEARTLAQTLNAGALPVPVKVAQTEAVPAP